MGLLSSVLFLNFTMWYFLHNRSQTLLIAKIAKKLLLVTTKHFGCPNNVDSVTTT